ncbi:ABC transporter ATP-binding protein [Roseiflexus sp.]|uniref:ABC transporter ATP-binding protein n=1 Tax=Roseiflexus sp. TaxID=2562120 RepID=UPI0021DE58A4|nr:ABC transporter ATP-binding protein [Roseiflexus sp.]GIV99195.1 MAG: macrolide export ATP-binding/permease protein MacB [Roseiflexus sp.]
MSAMISVRHLARTYRMGEVEVKALQGVSFDIQRGEFVAIMGPSGSGKSTLMNLIGCLDTPTAGSYHLDGLPVDQLDPNLLAAVRNKKIGFVFQQFHLLARNTALENVALPLAYRGRMPRAEQFERAAAALERVGLGHRKDHRPHELSGGQQQRVAIARALVTKPALLLADEPTGALDTRTSAELMELLTDLNHSGMTIVLVTHEHDVARYAQRMLELRDGALIHDSAEGDHDRN